MQQSMFAKIAPALLATLLAHDAWADTDCKNRGSVDHGYCDDDSNMVADPPKDPKRYKNPDTLVFTYTSAEDALVYENIFAPFTQYLAQCTGKKVVYYPIKSNTTEIDAMRSGRLHVAGFSTGTTITAVRSAGAVPFAVKGDAKEFQGYHLLLIVRKDSPFQKITDLKGKRVAHTSPTSNSGHLAPLALFPAQGLTPEKDYDILFSGKHDQSILGVKTNDYDAAAVASSVFHRMALRGQIKEDDFRVIYRSSRFPTSSFSYAHDLEPVLRDKIIQCFYDYRFAPEMQKAFDGADRFVPVSYQKEWEPVRKTVSSGAKVTSGVWAARKQQVPSAPAAAD